MKIASFLISTLTAFSFTISAQTKADYGVAAVANQTSSGLRLSNRLIRYI